MKRKIAASLLLAMGIVPAIVLLLGPYIGIPPKPGMRPIQIALGLPLLAMQLFWGWRVIRSTWGGR